MRSSVLCHTGVVPHPGDLAMNSHPSFLFLAGNYLPLRTIPLLSPANVTDQAQKSSLLGFSAPLMINRVQGNH